LKWVGLVPLRDTRNAIDALREMQFLGAAGAVVYGTVGERQLSDPMHYPFFDEFSRWGAPLCIHFGQSYPGLWPLTRTMLAGNIIGMSLPAFLAFYAITCGGLLDRYPRLRVGFFEFGSEWILYAVARIDKYRDMAAANGIPYNTEIGRKRALEYARSGSIFVSGESGDRVLPQEIELLGEDQFLYSSDFPHPEERDAGSNEIAERNDLTEVQKRKILWDNAIRFWGG
jgi:predicted TIM-barrel fold metal-dependent hydrolase